MIKILFFIENLSSGGAEKVLRTLVNNMDQTRFDITVMTVWPEDAEKYLAKGIRYKSLYAEKNRFNRLRYRAEAALNLTYPLHIPGGYDIEVAYLECGPTKIMAGSTNKKALKLAWVHCDLTKKEADSAAFVSKCRPWYAKYHSVVCVCNSVRQSFETLFGTEFKTAVLYNINDETEILSKTGLYSVEGAECPVVAAVGRLSYEKGNDRLVAACARLKNEGYAFRCRIIGDGPECNRLRKMIADLNLHNEVELLGFQENPYPWMAASDMIICPSRFEGFSTVVTESLILGKPIVTTDCSGMKELLGDSEYGLITENSEEGIYQGLKKLLDDPELLAQYEVRAHERGKAFSKDRLVKATEAFFISTLEANRAP